ncbi:hypothetical protein SUGI_0950320 [Cryptomeria japonica]|nr:hypothetical protein SUGI_0950320 [Cryptomeria japonica]
MTQTEMKMVGGGLSVVHAPCPGLWARSLLAQRGVLRVGECVRRRWLPLLMAFEFSLTHMVGWRASLAPDPFIN